MLKTVAILILIGVLCLSSFTFLHIALATSEPPALEWNKTFGKATRNDANWGNTVVQTSDGGYAIASTADFGLGEVWWLVKTDSAGNVEWNRTYPTDEQGRVFSVVIATDGGYVMAGDAYTAGNPGHARLVETDTNGTVEWEKTYTELDPAVAFSITQTGDGGYVLAGSKYYYDGWLMKTDVNGTVQWSKSFVEVNNTQLVSVVQTNDGGFVAVGATQYPPFTGKVDAYLVKTDSNGNISWSKEFRETTGLDYGTSICAVDGGFAIAGQTDINGGGDFWLLRTNETGDLIWESTYGGSSWDAADSIIQTRNGGYLLAGHTYSFGEGDSDFWLIETDSAGNLLWNQTFGGIGYDRANSVIQTRDRGYAVAGYTNSFSSDGSYEVWLLKLARSGSQTWIVDDDGPADFHTIQEAINAASDGDTIFVRNGIYSGPVVIDKTLTLQGENRNSTTIDGGSNEPMGSVILVIANNVRVSDFTIQDCREGGNAIWIDSYFNMTFSHNIITNCNEGVRMLYSSGNIVSYNIVEDCYYNTGVGIDYGSNNTVSHNTIINNHYGMSGGIDCHANTFSENALIGNDIGFGTTSYDNLFFHNNFVNNGINVIASGTNQFDIGYPRGGNYWSDYNGTDYDDDGIGDSPYIMDENNTDHYPLMSPWAPPDIEMENFETSKAIARQGSLITFDIQYEYQGNTPEIITLDVYLNSSLLSSESLILPPGHHWYTTRVWNTTGFAKGNYTVTALLQPLQDEVDTADNALAAYVFITIAGDLNGDKTVDIYDAVILANHFNLHPWQSLWDSNVDMNDDDVIDIFDAVILASHYGESWT
jgi:parallel beta-helix repeat protein